MHLFPSFFCIFALTKLFCMDIFKPDNGMTDIERNRNLLMTIYLAYIKAGNANPLISAMSDYETFLDFFGWHTPGENRFDPFLGQVLPKMPASTGEQQES